MGVSTISPAYLRLAAPSISLSGGMSNQPAGPTYWCENGAVYQMPTATAARMTLVGFESLAGLAPYCAKACAWGVAPASFYANTAFSAHDFPVAQDILPDPYPHTTDQCMVFATRYVAQFALPFMAAAGFSFLPNLVYTAIPWEQANSLSVQTPYGGKTITVTYVALTTSPMLKYGWEIMWDGPLLT